MKLNQTLHYGLKAMIELAASTAESGVMQKEIAERYNISNKFLDRIIASLKTAGLIVKLPGRKSGYKLASDPSDITVYDVYRAFEPEIEVHHCLSERSCCPESDECGVHFFFNEFNQETKKLMRSFSIRQLAESKIGAGAPA